MCCRWRAAEGCSVGKHELPDVSAPVIEHIQLALQILGERRDLQRSGRFWWRARRLLHRDRRTEGQVRKRSRCRDALAACRRLHGRRRGIAAAAAATGGICQGKSDRPEPCSGKNHDYFTAWRRSAARASVASSLAKQKRINRASGARAQNGDSGLAATPCFLASCSQKSVSARLETAA